LTDEIKLLTSEEADLLPISWPDVYFSPRYGHAVEASDGAQWRLAMWNGGAVLFPILLRPIGIALSRTVSLYDAVSPYGYSGTYVADSVSSSDLKAFRQEWRNMAREIGIVGEFQRLSPFVPGRAQLVAVDRDLNVTQHSDIVTIPTSSYELYWESTTGRLRTAVRKALRLGYQCSVRRASLGDVDHGSPFRTLYRSTMQRVGADSYFNFPESYYQRLVGGLGDSTYMASARNSEGKVVGATLVLVWKARAHLHLGGVSGELLQDGVNALLIHEQVRWAAESGYKLVNLGGGRRSHDPLFRFKASFGGERRPYSTTTTVLDHRRFRALEPRGYKT
jgi:hypothetical protein